MLGPDTTTGDETQTEDKQKNNSTLLFTLPELPFFENINQSESTTESLTGSSESTEDFTPFAKEQLPETDIMSGEASSTPKREQKLMTQEEMIVNIATAVLEEQKKKGKGAKVVALEPFEGD
uniref:Uncharacterized protein n=1 Tax=Moniliophthora roreri TaxID=221103 RepID=A0A0W0ETR6_MONRR